MCEAHKIKFLVCILPLVRVNVYLSVVNYLIVNTIQNKNVQNKYELEGKS